MTSAHIVQATPEQLQRHVRLLPADLNPDRGDDGHLIPNLVYRCSDGYFEPFLSQWYGRWFASHPDSLALPGGALELCLDYQRMQQLAARARLLHERHETVDIWIVFHNFCGGYVYHRNVGDAHVERHHQLQDMAQIERIYATQGITTVEEVRLHFAIIRTQGLEFVPLRQLQQQASGWGIEPIVALERDIADRILQLPAGA